MFKVQYASLIGVLQGFLLAGKEFGIENTKVVEQYDKLLEKITDDLEEIICDVYNCGYADQRPTVEEIVTELDEFLQKRFAISLTDFKEPKNDDTDRNSTQAPLEQV
jgi:hypothetical protein